MPSVDQKAPNLIRFGLFLNRLLTNTENPKLYFDPILSWFTGRTYHPDMIAAKVLSLRWENSNIYTLTLKLKGKKFRPFRAGQFISLESTINGRRFVRCFSISSSPSRLTTRGEITLSIRAQDQGKVTPQIPKEISAGDYVYVSQATGEFCIERPRTHKTLLAGGSGVTPFLSMLEEASFRSTLDQFSLIYYVPNKHDAAFVQQLESYSAHGLDLKIIETHAEGHFRVAHLNPDHVRDSDYFICGPQNMISQCQEKLIETDIPQGQIHSERFTLNPSVNMETSPSIESGQEIVVHCTSSNSRLKVNKANANESLLSIAEQSGLNPLSGCRMGVCHQCVCTKTSGRVRNLLTGTTSDSGPEKIQLCISQAIDELTIEI